MAKKKVYGKCRICGEEKQLTQEHYIPRAAGGGTKITLYNGDELVKSFQKDEDGNDYKLRGKIKQNGLSEYSLCKECNELSGALYDKEFARFHNGIHYVLSSSIKVPEGQVVGDYLENKVATMQLADIKPLNIAKRMLVSFCSVEHPGLADMRPEIRKAILDKNYQPNTDDFALYMSLHLGNSAYYGTVAAPKSIRRQIHQAMLSNIFVDQDVETGATEVVASALTEPFGSISALAGRKTLSTTDLRLGETKTAQDGRVLVKGSVYADQGSDDNTLVRVQGL